ncbi:hypothetical protein ACWDSL_52325 [Streptomyces sp. NPDC000941]
MQAGPHIQDIIEGGDGGVVVGVEQRLTKAGLDVQDSAEVIGKYLVAVREPPLRWLASGTSVAWALSCPDGLCDATPAASASTGNAQLSSLIGILTPFTARHP